MQGSISTCLSKASLITSPSVPEKKSVSWPLPCLNARYFPFRLAAFRKAWRYIDSRRACTSLMHSTNQVAHFATGHITTEANGMRAHQQRSPWAAVSHNETSLLVMREEKMTTQKMRARIAQAKPCVDTAPPKTMAMPHLTSRWKKVQLKEHREEEIVRDNQKLLDKK